MKFWMVTGWMILSVACAPVRGPGVNQDVQASAAPPRAGEAPQPAPLMDKPAAAPVSGPVPSPRATRSEVEGVVFEGVAFDSRAGRLVVVDQAGGPGTEFADARAAAVARGGIAAVNAGFFTPEGDPLGWVISSGKRTGGWNSASSLGSGVWHEDSSGAAAISRRETLGRERAATMRELIQSGPMLIDKGRPVSGLDGVKTSARTLVMWDGGNSWWIGRSSPCTLAACAAAIAQSRPAEWKVRHALNLDGGRSADMWISGDVRGGPLTRRGAWNRAVRNFLVLLDQPSPMGGIAPH